MVLTTSRSFICPRGGILIQGSSALSPVEMHTDRSMWRHATGEWSGFQGEPHIHDHQMYQALTLLVLDSLVLLVRQSSQRPQFTSLPIRGTGYKPQTKSAQIGTSSEPVTQMAPKTGSNGLSTVSRILVLASTLAYFAALKPSNLITGFLPRVLGSSTPLIT